jgi:hypothetical protein
MQKIVIDRGSIGWGVKTSIGLWQIKLVTWSQCVISLNFGLNEERHHIARGFLTCHAEISILAIM